MKNRVKQIRLEQGLSQLELGKELGCKQSYISKIEKGQISLTDGLLQKLALALNVYPTELIDDPAWRNAPPESINDQLMQTICELVFKAGQENKKVTPHIAARIIISLYKKRAKVSAKPVSAKQLAADIELLIDHERGREQR
jgi:transcriptional regulator with XRE-family HTH domain